MIAETLTVERKDLIARIRSSRVLAERTLSSFIDVVSKMYLQNRQHLSDGQMNLTSRLTT